MAARPNLAGRFWYDCVYWSSFTFFTFGFSYRRDGWGNVPTEGPLLFLANHQSMFDPVLVGLASRRYLSYLARKNLFEQPILAPLIRSLDAIPIDRGLGKDGIQAVLDALGVGRAVLVFPEGERTHDGKVQALKPGVSLLIKRSRCPIVPVGIAGAFGAWSRFTKIPCFSPLALPPAKSTIAVSIGRPIDSERYRVMNRDEMMDDLQQELVKQFGVAERRRRRRLSKSSVAGSPL
jgi:1-acyl-sn-glycerol-3-phosphate acyltransferase